MMKRQVRISGYGSLIASPAFLPVAKHRSQSLQNRTKSMDCNADRR